MCRSTIVKLLLRLYDPDSGSLFLDDHDLKSLTQVNWEYYLRYNVRISSELQLPTLVARFTRVEPLLTKLKAATAEIVSLGVKDSLRSAVAIVPQDTVCIRCINSVYLNLNLFYFD